LTDVHKANPDGLYERPTIGINGEWPLPIMTATVNDTVVVNVINQLGKNPSYPISLSTSLSKRLSLGNQSTTLHFHGMYQNGTTEMDGANQVSQCGIPPGSLFTYTFTVSQYSRLKSNLTVMHYQVKQAGTFWYHSHYHSQYPDGLRAPFIVSDPDYPYKGQFDEEFVLSVSDWYHEEMQVLIPKFMSKANPTGAEPVPQSALFNDRQNLTIAVQPGKTYLFHVINVGAFAGQYIWFEGHNITIVEVDGVYTEKAEAEMIYLSAAQRCSFMVTTKNETSTNYAFVGSMDTVTILPSLI
jgi:iron transport multicopper oxidase